MTTAPLFLVDDAARLTGASESQIEHFVRSNVVEPAEEAPRRGMSRSYSLRNLVELTVAAELLEGGIVVPWMRAILDLTIKKHWKALIDPNQRDTRSILLLDWPSQLRTSPPRTNRPEGFRYGVMLTAIADVAATLEKGHTIHAAINVKAVIERLEAATGLMLS